MPAVRLLTVSLCGLLLVGCNGKSDSTSKPTVVVTTQDRTVDGATPPGTVLPLGGHASVRWRAGKTRSSLVGLKVNKVVKGQIKDLDQFPLSDAARASSVYYVSATVRNNGHADLGGKRRLTLFGQVSDSLVVPAVTLNSPFDRCNNPPLPKPFKQDARAHVCLLMLAPNHGKISQIQWRADPAGPISWRVR